MLSSGSSTVFEAALGAAIGFGSVASLIFGAWLTWYFVQDIRAEREYENLTGRVKRQVRKNKGEK